ncbi:MAG: IS66 family transposase [Planctomycetaceae bacterium]|nr:IS66 family transposase [Planctomycetaceae bacterium]
MVGWYDEIGDLLRHSAVLHADETGWRVNGKTYWLWCFTTQDATYFVIDRSRASPVVLRFLKNVFNGILVTDFWGVYNAVVCAGKQKCLVHLLRELKKVTKYSDKSVHWLLFSKRLKRILRDARRLCGEREKMPESDYERLRNRLEQRLTKLLEQEWNNADAKRLVKRLRRHRNELLTFLYYKDLPFDNNHTERVIRGGVVMRKNSYCNRSLKDAETQAILMSIFRTLKQRNYKNINIIIDAIKIYHKTRKLPKLPTKK